MFCIKEKCIPRWLPPTVQQWTEISNLEILVCHICKRTEGAGLMSYAAANHQGELNVFLARGALCRPYYLWLIFFWLFKSRTTFLNEKIRLFFLNAGNLNHLQKLSICKNLHSNNPVNSWREQIDNQWSITISYELVSISPWLQQVIYVRQGVNKEDMIEQFFLVRSKIKYCLWLLPIGR